MSIDPLAAKYPWNSPYAFSGNRVIDAVELEGLEPSESLISDQGKLTQPVIALLSSAFRFSEESLANSTWVPYWEEPIWSLIVGIPEGTNASVFGASVVHDNAPRNDRQWFRLISHEQSHRNEVSNEGFAFYSRYVLEGAFKEYRSITTEAVAFGYGDNGVLFGFDKSSRLLAYNGGEVESVLFDPSIPEWEKVVRLRFLGNKFRRDVLIPDLINEMERELFDLKSNITAQLQREANMGSEGASRYLGQLNSGISSLEEQINLLKKEQDEITNEFGE